MNFPPETVMVVFLTDGPGYVEAEAGAAFNVDEYDLDRLRLMEKVCNCNTSRMYPDEGMYRLGCGSLDGKHTDINRVSVQTRNLGDLRCSKNDSSDDFLTVFACTWR